MIDVKDLPDIIYQNAKQHVTASAPSSLDAAIEQVERNLIVRSFRKYGSSRKVAQDLKISQTRASKLIRKYCH
ncbi:TyrR/PhhR family helix-turn-helix DNA-binding protein [Brevibacillus sp. H7]|jgi:TyrR family helix-turn-helix protein|uniref:TyrR/PhhR family helix-turn-helix DNA-binding protein n=1 Tax=Brevibacillus sp. H7 TaxID=3349138 RepID=UPI003814A14E